jgi:hypothetical protein
MQKKYPWIYIENYDELSPGKRYPSMRDSFAAQPYPEQTRVAAYLRNGTSFMASVALPRDVITGKRFPGETLVMHDGKYCWSTDLVYYVEKYNLRLPVEIEQHILKKAG